MLSISKSSNGSLLILPDSIDFKISCLSCLTEPIMIDSEESFVLHIGKGIPQNLDLDKFQSFAFNSQLPNLPVPVDSGFQLIFLLSFISLSFSFVTLINHESSG